MATGVFIMQRARRPAQVVGMLDIMCGFLECHCVRSTAGITGNIHTTTNTAGAHFAKIRGTFPQLTEAVL